MKRGDADPEEEEALASKQRDVEDARYEFAMRVIWVALGITCAVLGMVLLPILLR